MVISVRGHYIWYSAFSVCSHFVFWPFGLWSFRFVAFRYLSVQVLSFRGWLLWPETMIKLYMGHKLKLNLSTSQSWYARYFSQLHRITEIMQSSELSSTKTYKKRGITCYLKLDGSQLRQIFICECQNPRWRLKSKMAAKNFWHSWPGLY